MDLANARPASDGVPGGDEVVVRTALTAPATATSKPLDALVSMFPSALDANSVRHLPLREVLESIRDGSYAERIDHVRAILERDGADAYREAKKHLPAFITAGKFSRRANAALLIHSGCLILDFDHLGAHALQALLTAVRADAHAVFAFVSPSGDGLKVGIRTQPVEDDAAHKRAWAAAAKHAREAWGAIAKEDKSGKDVSRLCFVAADSDLYMNEAATAIELPAPEPESALLPWDAEAEYPQPDHATLKPGVPSDGPEREADSSDVDKARAALARLNPMRAEDYDSWIKVGMACKAAGVPFAEWDAFSRKSLKYDAAVCRKKWGGFPADSKLNCGLLIRWARIDNGEPPNMSEAGAVVGTELWFARTMAIQHSHILKHVWPWRCWVAWDSTAGRWRKDESGVAWQAAKITLQRMVKSAVAAAGTDAGKEALERASKFMKKNALANALKLAASEPNVVALPSIWDSHPYLLNCANGTVDLRDGKLREHRREDHLTKSTGVALGGDAPQWTAFLEHIQPDPEVREYLQRAVGYSAIGSVTEHVLHIAWGSGANGKSVFINAITHALGDYSLTVPGSLLVSDGLRGHPTEIASLHGVRFAVASETEEDGKLRAAQLKQLTGGDELTARRMREDFWSFKPSHTLWLQTNHKPQANDATHGFWRRVRLVPFTVTIPKDEQDRYLTDKLRVEAGGILRWIIEGAVKYLSEGLEPPAKIAAATDEYREEEDDLGEFIAWCGLVPDDNSFMASRSVFEAYTRWAQIADQKPLGQRTLTRRLVERGFKQVRQATARGFNASARRSM